MVAPAPVLEHVHGIRADARSTRVARVLGARHLAQAVLSGVRPTPAVLALGVWVDAVHALSAVGLALLDPSRARAGLTDATVATVWSAAGARDLTRGVTGIPPRRRRRERWARMVLRRAPGGSFLLARASCPRRSGNER